jgi:hypothetical protein
VFGEGAIEETFFCFFSSEEKEERGSYSPPHQG